MRMFFKLFKRYFLHFLPFFIVFIASFYNPIDSDLGWHLKYGEYFFKNGKILQDNVFSSFMPNYHWVNHSWGTDIITYFTYNNFGFLGLTILGALVITLTFYFFSKAAKLTIWNKVLIFPLLLYLLGPINSVSFRSQLISLMFIGILFLILSKFAQNKKYLYFLPFIFLAWVNLHGEFILGLALFFLWIAVLLAGKLFFFKEEKPILIKEGKFLFAIFGLSLIACLINPFGIGVFYEAFNHFGNPASKYILEWISFEDLSNQWWNQIIVANLMFVGLIYLFFTKKVKENFAIITITLIVFSLSFWERRYAWPSYYLAMPLIKPISDFFKPDSKKYTDIFSFIILFLTLVITVIFKSPFTQYSSMSWDIYCKSYLSCSPKAAEFLKNYNFDKKKLLTLYNWGGWLIWNYPEIKPTIDGRMPFWKDKNGYSAFMDYYSLEQNWKDIDKSKYDIAFMSRSKSIYDRLTKLVKENKWKLVYKDKYSGIFVRNSVTN